MNLEGFSDQFDLFLVDVWGVLTDGSILLDHAHTFLNNLKTKKQSVVLLSNTPFKKEELAHRLHAIGISPMSYDEIVTGGDVLRKMVKNQEISLNGHAYYYIGPDETMHLLEGMGFQSVQEISEADFILVNGYPKNSSSIQSLRTPLMKAISKGTPLLCPNPDKYITLSNGEVVFCAGKIARQYELLGGNVIYTGKPYPPIYQYVLDLFPRIKKQRILVIGDGLETDIAGAQRMGLKSLLISTPDFHFGEENLIEPNWHVSTFGEKSYV